jgi:hypothetical protein
MYPAFRRQHRARRKVATIRCVIPLSQDQICKCIEISHVSQNSIPDFALVRYSGWRMNVQGGGKDSSGKVHIRSGSEL